MTEGKPTWRFPRAFWTGNAAELCERAAFYGTFIALQLYLTRVVGLTDDGTQLSLGARTYRIQKRKSGTKMLTVDVTDLETGEIVLRKQRDRMRRASKPLIGW